MLDLNFIIDNLNLIKDKTAKRHYRFDFDKLIELAEKRKKIIKEVEELKRKRNEGSKEISRSIKAGKDTNLLNKEMRELSEKIKTLDTELKKVNNEIAQMLLNIPNIIDDAVPIGEGETDNVVIRSYGEKPCFDFVPKPHWDIAENLGLVDFNRATKLAKSRFAIYLGDGAKLERSLINFMLELHTSKGYKEVIPPLLVNETTMTGTGQLPKFEEELFKCERDNLYLIPTAEVPLTNIPSGEIIPYNVLPLYYVAYTPCFRREAGSYGKDVRGLIRQHQFNKVELVKIVSEENSNNELETLLRDAEEILKLLNIHYRVISLCSGDLGFSASKTYDIEVWLPGLNCYKEISSCSNFKGFQARRANIKYRDEKGKIHFAHTLNGSGLAVGRTFLAILENYQTAEGFVRIPDILKDYFKNKEYIK
jgi:seryl-tRNA synthetase